MNPDNVTKTLTTINTATLMMISFIKALSLLLKISRSSLIKDILVQSVFSAPVHNQNKPEQHSTQVSEVCYIISCPVHQPGNQLYQTINDHKIFCFDRDGKINIQQSIRKKH